jgi:cation transport ATPase
LLLSACAEALAAAPHKTAIHRVDMQVAGSSCATCLMRLEKKLKAEKGVIKAVVSIFKPYRAAIIYDESQTKWANINKVLESEKVSAANFQDTPIKDVPLVLDPK